jgi:reverse transcriptase-like protein
MLNQSFSADNFRKILEYENRRGIYLEGVFFPEAGAFTNRIKDRMVAIRALQKRKSVLSEEDYRNQLSALNAEKIELKAGKERLLSEGLEAASAEVSSRSFRVQLTRTVHSSGAAVYVADNRPGTYFAGKQLQQNIRTLYKVKQSNRNEVIRQLKAALDDSFPKYLIRTDFAHFYESIPHDKLIRKLEEDALLEYPSRKIVKQILMAYRSLSGSDAGIPRGVGVSAYLAELFMRQFDRGVGENHEVVFYARYVDDVIVVFSPHPSSAVGSFLPFLKDQAGRLGLSLNLDPKKTFERDLAVGGKYGFDYLGYNISVGDGPVRIGLSRRRMQKYKGRIRICFASYRTAAKAGEKKARKLLVKRIRFLTGNVILHNSKRSVMIGVFYSNSLLSSSRELDPLDKYLAAQVNSMASDPLKRRLRKLSFQDGFLKRRFVPLGPGDFSAIMRIWKYEA